MRVREKIGMIKNYSVRRKFAKCGDTSYIDRRNLIVVGGDKIFIGNNSVIRHGARLQAHNDSKICIGDNTGIVYNVTILTGIGADVHIGDYVTIASNVFICSGNHRLDPEDSESRAYGALPLGGAEVLIDDHSWIGEKSVVLPGVKIGKYSVVGAGSVVTHDVPDYCIVAGNPAKILKRYNFCTHSWEKAI